MASKREKKSWSSRKKKLWLVICLIIVTSGLYAIFVYLNTRNTGTKFEYTLSDKSFGNPLMGYCPFGRKKKQSLKMFILSMLISHGKNWNLKRATGVSITETDTFQCVGPL